MCVDWIGGVLLKKEISGKMNVVRIQSKRHLLHLLELSGPAFKKNLNPDSYSGKSCPASALTLGHLYHWLLLSRLPN